MNSTPTVTVLLPTLNSERFLRETLQSIDAQSYRDFELLAVDSGSRDGTLAVLAEPWRFPVRVLDAKGKNLAESLNLGVEQAAGRFIARIDGDDLAEPERLALQVAFLDANPRAVLVGGQLRIIDEWGASLGTRAYPTEPERVRRGLSVRCVIAHPAVMFRRQAAIAAGLYDPRPPLGQCEDYDFWLRLLGQGELANLGVAVLRYRIHGGALKATRTRNMLKATLAIKGRAVARGHLEPSFDFLWSTLGQMALLALPASWVYSLFVRVELTAPAK
jgi:glycosyltransferase involved in cell wall biosynthesis